VLRKELRDKTRTEIIEADEMFQGYEGMGSGGREVARGRGDGWLEDGK
jgi:hypothetical protein